MDDETIVLYSHDKGCPIPLRLAAQTTRQLRGLGGSSPLSCWILENKWSATFTTRRFDSPLRVRSHPTPPPRLAHSHSKVSSLENTQ